LKSAICPAICSVEGAAFGLHFIARLRHAAFNQVFTGRPWQSQPGIGSVSLSWRAIDHASLQDLVDRALMWICLLAYAGRRAAQTFLDRSARHASFVTPLSSHSCPASPA
jgi:hypothetical protein